MNHFCSSLLRLRIYESLASSLKLPHEQTRITNKVENERSTTPNPRACQKVVGILETMIPESYSEVAGARARLWEAEQSVVRGPESS